MCVNAQLVAQLRGKLKFIVASKSQCLQKINSLLEIRSDFADWPGNELKSQEECLGTLLIRNAQSQLEINASICLMYIISVICLMFKILSFSPNESIDTILLMQSNSTFLYKIGSYTILCQNLPVNVGPIVLLSNRSWTLEPC